MPRATQSLLQSLLQELQAIAWRKSRFGDTFTATWTYRSKRHQLVCAQSAGVFVDGVLLPGSWLVHGELSARVDGKQTRRHTGNSPR